MGWVTGFCPEWGLKKAKKLGDTSVDVTGGKGQNPSGEKAQSRTRKTKPMRMLKIAEFNRMYTSVEEGRDKQEQDKGRENFTSSKKRNPNMKQKVRNPIQKLHEQKNEKKRKTK